MSKKCYWLSGNEMGEGFAPCNPAAANSACCMLDKPDPDICLSSGICYSQTDKFEGFMYINGCTDKTGKATHCAQMCNPSYHKNVDSLDVLECRRGTYCCRDSGTSENCCTDLSALISTGLGKLMLATKTATVSSGATSPTSSLNPSAAATECPKSNGVVIGGAVGGTLGAALLASLAALAFLYKRRSSGYKIANAGSNYDPKAQSQRAAELPHVPPQPVHELGP